MKLSIVSPVYRAELVLEELVERISKSIPLDFSTYEIILVADFNADNSWQKKRLLSSIWFLNKCVINRLGIVGLYIGKTFEGVKNRPTYIIEKTTDE